MTKKVPSDAFFTIIIWIFLPLYFLIFLPRVKGRRNIPRHSRAILSGNHVSSLDAITALVGPWKPVHYLAKVELFRGWFLTWLFLHLGATPVDRSQPKNHGAMTAAATRLAREQLVGIFPEGTTSHNGELLPFKFGAVAVAQKTGAPIVPFSITGRYIPFVRSLKITFGTPLFIDGDLKTANQKLRRAIQKLIRENQ